MNNPLDIALTRIHHTIPQEILEFAFQKRQSYEIVDTLDNQILNKVIRDRVAKDMNIYGGKQKDILLRREYLEPMERNIDDSYMHTGRFSLYRIPPEAREDLPIVEVTNVKFWGSFAGNMNQIYGSFYGANVQTIGNAVLDAHTFSSQPRRPDVELLASDLVRLSPSQHSSIKWILSCRLAYDDCFTNLNTSTIDPFSDLCVYAVQAYIYLTCAVPMDKAIVQGGYPIGVFKSIIDSYADANQKYVETLDRVVGAMQLDPTRLKELLPYII